MAVSFKSIMKQGVDFVKEADRKKLVFFSVLAIVIIAVGITGAVMLNRTNYTVLYSGLSADEAGTIYEKLQAEGVEAKVSGTGTLLVPEDQADELRIRLAAEGYPSTGLNYDIFTSSSDLGATDLEQVTLKQYQLQENMRSTISKFDKIEDCIVIVNLAASSSYVVSSNASEASVAIELKLEDGESLDSSEAKAIANFALTCVPTLELENVSIVDSQLNYYDVSDNSNSSVGTSETQQKLTEQIKGVLKDQVLTVVEPAVGGENIAVSVNVALNFDAETVSTVEFTPPIDGETEGLVRSSEEIYDAVAGDDTASGEAGTDSNGVSASEYETVDENGNTILSYDNTYNYELNQVETEIEKAQGSIEDLSVSVLINSNIEGISGYVDTIKSLVANAIGVDENYITVGLMPFVENSGDMDFGDYLAQNEKIAREYARTSLIRTGIIAGVILLMFVAALLLLRRKKHVTEEYVGAGGGNILDVKLEKTTGTEPVGEARTPLGEPVIKKSDDIEKVESLMDKYPETAVQILRSWMTED